MTKKDMQGVLRTQLEDNDIVVKTMAIQDVIWPGYSECRLFTANGDVYSAMINDDIKITDFILCPKENK